jgi:hypothetical protein
LAHATIRNFIGSARKKLVTVCLGEPEFGRERFTHLRKRMWLTVGGQLQKGQH